jgi:hypothetical protein
MLASHSSAFSARANGARALAEVEDLRSSEKPGSWGANCGLTECLEGLDNTRGKVLLSEESNHVSFNSNLTAERALKIFRANGGVLKTQKAMELGSLPGCRWKAA